MVEENPLSEAVRERLKNPFAGSFGISWLLWNWRVPVLLTGSVTKPFDVIFRIENYFRNSSFWFLLFWPFLSALAYAFGAPFINTHFSRWLLFLDAKKEEYIREAKLHALDLIRNYEMEKGEREVRRVRGRFMIQRAIRIEDAFNRIRAKVNLRDTINEQDLQMLLTALKSYTSEKGEWEIAHTRPKIKDI